MNNAVAIKLGDKVSFVYGDVTGEGILESFSGGWVYIKLTHDLDMGFRVETKSVGLDPYQSRSLKVIESGPSLTSDDVGHMPAGVGGGQYLRNRAA